MQSDFKVEIADPERCRPVYRRGNVRRGSKTVSLSDAEPDLEGGHASDQRAGGYYKLCDAGYGQPHPRL